LESVQEELEDLKHVQMHGASSDDGDFIDDYDEEDEASLERLQNQGKQRRGRRVVASEVGSMQASGIPKASQNRSVRSSRAKVSDLRPANTRAPRQSKTTKQPKQEPEQSVVKEIFGSG